MIQTRIIVSLLVAFLYLLHPSINAAEINWKSIGQFDQFIDYYDPSSLSYPAKGIVRFSTKEECADQKKCREIHKKWIQESKGQLSPDYERWAYRINSMEIHCKNKQMRFLSVKNVDDRGQLIDSDVDKPTEWLDVKNPWNQRDPNETLYQILCK